MTLSTEEISLWLKNYLKTKDCGVMVKDGEIYLSIDTTQPILQEQLLEALQKQFLGIKKLHIIRHQHKAEPDKPKQRVGLPIEGVEKVILVASGKGGVGKSTITLNLALAMQSLGNKVAILDSDIYGPSLPTLVAINEKPEVTIDKKLIPLKKIGLKLMSIGFMVPAENAIIWRGLMVQSATQQMLNEVKWNDDGNQVDYLFIDLPPGTGDVQLTIAQKVKVDGAVIVSTPQDLALIDAHRAVSMFNKVNIPIIGIIENMSHFICPHCNNKTDIFNHNTIKGYADEWYIPYLGDIPLNAQLRQTCDQGTPLDYQDKKDPIVKKFIDIARFCEQNLRFI